MPYIIPKSLRKKLLSGKVRPKCSGELNYLFSMLDVGSPLDLGIYKPGCFLGYGQIHRKIITDYIKDLGESYQTYNDICGALVCSKHEFIRRYPSKAAGLGGDFIQAELLEELYAWRIGPYEDKKIKENGDII